MCFQKAFKLKRLTGELVWQPRVVISYWQTHTQVKENSNITSSLTDIKPDIHQTDLSVYYWLVFGARLRHHLFSTMLYRQ